MSLTAPSALAQVGWSFGWIVAVVAGVIAFVILIVIAQFFRIWLQAYMSNADVTLFELIGMRLRKVDLTTVVHAKIYLVKAGIHDVTVNDLESHYLAGGRVVDVSRAMIAANHAGKHLDWKQACANDLAGRDILKGAGRIGFGLEIQQFVGQSGISATELWPMGRCDFDGVDVPCFSEHGMIGLGASVEGVRVDGSSLIVREKEY